MSDLNSFYDKLDAAFSTQNLSESAKEAAIYDFIQRARAQNLSFVQTSKELENPDQINQSVAVGKKGDEFIEDSPDASTDTASTLLASVTSATLALGTEVGKIANIASRFIPIIEHMDNTLIGIEKTVSESHTTTAHNKKILSEVHTAAGELKTNLTQAIATTQSIVDRLDTIPTRLDAQFQKLELLEKGVGDAVDHAKDAKAAAVTAADNTDPPKTQKATRSENLKMLGWNTIASTLVGTAFGMVATHYIAKNPPPPPITIQFQLAENGNCAQSETIKKLQAGQPVTLQAGANTVCLALPQQQNPISSTESPPKSEPSNQAKPKRHKQYTAGFNR